MNVMHEVRKLKAVDLGLTLNNSLLNQCSYEKIKLLSDLYQSEDDFEKELLKKLHDPWLKHLCEHLYYSVEDSMEYHGEYIKGMPYCDYLQGWHEFRDYCNRERRTELAKALISLGISKSWLRHCFFGR